MKSKLPSLKMNLNLDEPLSIQRALATTARLGFDDEIRGVKAIPTGLEIISALGCVSWRQGTSGTSRAPTRRDGSAPACACPPSRVH